MTGDTLSEVLRAVRLQGAGFFDVDVSAPWFASAPPAAEVAPRVLPGAEHVIAHHAVTAGSCWGTLPGHVPVRLETGDVIVFPQGDAHVMASEPGLVGPPDLARFFRPIGGQLPIAIADSGEGQRVRLACGFFGCDARPFNPRLDTLPAHDWSLDELASAAGLSRSGLAEVAEAMGYGSEAAFSRAFKKLVGSPPATWRAPRRSAPAAVAGGSPELGPRPSSPT